MSDALRAAPTDGQLIALEQLRELAADSDAIQIVRQPGVVEADEYLTVDVSLDCSGVPASDGGLTLRVRERFEFRIPPAFPYAIPVVRTAHARWRGVPHVQWGTVVCLYASPSTEWNPADGMRGLVERLVLWLRRAAQADLDPDDMPLHPPVAYITSGAGQAVIRSDLGQLAPQPSTAGRATLPSSPDAPSGGAADQEEEHAHFVVALCRHVNDGRFDVVDWIDYDTWLSRVFAGSPTPRVSNEDFGVLTVLLDREFTFEYPHLLDDLLAGLGSLSVERSQLLVRMAVVAWAYGSPGAAPPTRPAHLLIGTPSRRSAQGVLRQHLVCWRLDNVGNFLIERVTQLLGTGTINDAVLAQIVTDVGSWVVNGTTSWVWVHEARPEVTVRRDDETPAAWLLGKRVLLLGAGALGAPIAEFIIRAGAVGLEIVDKDIVTPGILVRQPYNDNEIGYSKSKMLEARLQRIRPEVQVNGFHADAITWCLHGQAAPPGFHLVIDATADASVSSALERARAQDRESWPPVFSVGIGHEASRGVVTVSRPGATGAGRDILRRVALRARRDPQEALQQLAEDIFPETPRHRPFQPEPGCSSPTFRGSAAQLGALAGQLLDAGLQALSDRGPDDAGRAMAAACVTLDGSDSMASSGVVWLGWDNDDIVTDDTGRYEVRLSQAATSSIRSECRRGARVRSPDYETGGSLFGEIDDAVGCIWVDAASGPPPDSLLSPFHFEHGTEGVQDLVNYHRPVSKGLTSYLGLWHSHPDGPASPSPTDESSMDIVVTPALGAVQRAVFLIVGGLRGRWGSWLDSGDGPALYAHFSRRSDARELRAAPPIPENHRAVAVRGGWSVPSARRHQAARRRWSFLRRLRHRRHSQQVSS